MVGIAGKSQACNTCRERRVKCDLRRPFCLKCIGSKRECKGYDRESIFVNRTTANPSTTATSVVSGLTARSRSKARVFHSRKEADLRYLFQESATDCIRFRQYAVGLLKHTYLPKEQVLRNVPTKTVEGSFSWVYPLNDLTERSKALDTALFAFCLVQLHVTQKHGTVTLYECLEQYNAGLQLLHHDLDDTHVRVREETLGAILTLSTCEFFIGSIEDSYSVHARGIAEILRLRGAKTSDTPTWRHFFSRMRVVCTLEALTKRKAQILEHDIWHQIRANPGINSPVDEVFHMLASAPEVLEKAASLVYIESAITLHSTSASTVHSLLAVAKSLESWVEQVKATSPTKCYREIPTITTNPADDDASEDSGKVFPLVFEFESPNIAIPILMCWSVCAQLYSSVIQVSNLCQRRKGRECQSTRLGHSLQRRHVEEALLDIGDAPRKGYEMACNVCRSMEYLHRVEMGTFGSQSTSYPCWSAVQYFRLHEGHERELAWVQNINKMQGPGTQWGLTAKVFSDISQL